MLTENELLKAVLKIAVAITDGESGDIDLTCPKCDDPGMVFSYAINRLPRHGFYVHCKKCGLLHHFVLGSQPPNFREDLILPEYQKLEDQAMKFADDHEAGMGTQGLIR